MKTLLCALLLGLSTNLLADEPGKRAAEDGKKKPAAEADGAKKNVGPRDGEGKKPAGPRDGEAPKAAGKELIVRVTDKGDEVKFGRERVAVNLLRGFLSREMAKHGDKTIVVEADENVPAAAVNQVMDALRDNGAKGAQLRGGNAKDR